MTTKISEKESTLTESSVGPVCLGLLLLFCIGSPLYIPDSYEQALGWLCRSGEHPFCSDLDLFFRPPAMSFALAPFTLFMPAFIAVGIVAWLSASWSMQPLARSIRNVLGRDYMWAATFTLLGSWATLRLLMLADARIFVLLPLFWSWAISLSLKDSDRRMGILCGCLMGVAALTRPEVLLSSLFLIGALAWRIRWGVRWTALGFLAPMGLWIGLLSQKAGRLVLGPRYWEGNLLAIWEWIPRREALRLYGMGLYSPEARTLATDPLKQSIQPDILSGMGWFLSNAGTMVPPWIWIIGLGTIAYGVRQKKYRLHSVAALGLSAPYFAASFLPQARAPIFPQANFIPLYIVILIAFGVGSWALLRKYIEKITIRIPVFGLLLLVNAWFIPQPEIPSGIEYSDAGKAARVWLQENPPKSLQSGYENASLSWLSNGPWRQRSSIWEGARSDWILYSSVDNSFPLSNVEPAAFWASDREWVLLVQTTNP